MSVKLENNAATKAEFPSKGFVVGKNIVAVIYYLILIIALCSVVGFVKTAVFDRSIEEFYPGLLFWAQASLGYGIFALVLAQARSIVNSAFEQETPFCAGQGRRLRFVALLFLLLAILGAVFSYACAAVEGSMIAAPSFNACLGGFPGYDDWALAFAQSAIDPSTLSDATTKAQPCGVSIDATSLVIACFAWLLSYVFDQGQHLQEEQDATL